MTDALRGAQTHTTSGSKRDRERWSTYTVTGDSRRMRAAKCKSTIRRKASSLYRGQREAGRRWRRSAVNDALKRSKERRVVLIKVPPLRYRLRSANDASSYTGNRAGAQQSASWQGMTASCGQSRACIGIVVRRRNATHGENDCQHALWNIKSAAKSRTTIMIPLLRRKSGDSSQDIPPVE